MSVTSSGTFTEASPSHLRVSIGCVDADAGDKNDVEGVVQVARRVSSPGPAKDPKPGPLLYGLSWIVIVCVLSFVNDAVPANDTLLVADRGGPRDTDPIHDGERQLISLTAGRHSELARWTVQTPPTRGSEAVRRLPTTGRRDTQGLRDRPSANRTAPTAVQLFGEFCADCHGDDGRGSEVKADFPTIPNFVDSLWRRSRSDAELAVSITNGRGDGMPPFGEYLTRSQVAALVDHVRSLAPESVNRSASGTSDFARKYAELKQEWDALARELADLQSQSH